MNKELLDKVLDILLKGGVDQSIIDEVESLKKEDAPVEEVATETEETVEEPTPEDAPVEEEGEPAPAVEPETVETPAPEGDLPPVDETPVEEVPAKEPVAPSEPTLPKGVEPVDLAQDVPPAEEPLPEEVPTAAPVDEESKKVIAALEARISSLEEALRKGGILKDEQPTDKSVGVDDPTNISDYHDDDADFDALLDSINRRKI